MKGGEVSGYEANTILSETRGRLCNFVCMYSSCFVAVAGPVRSLTAVGENEDTLIVTWSAPLQPNGTITQYTVSVFPYDGSGSIRRQTITAQNEFRGLFSTGLGEFSCMLSVVLQGWVMDCLVLIAFFLL